MDAGITLVKLIFVGQVTDQTGEVADKTPQLRGTAHVTFKVSARGIAKQFAGVEVLTDVDLDLMPGEIHALLGENSAGNPHSPRSWQACIAERGPHRFWRAFPSIARTAALATGSF